MRKRLTLAFIVLTVLALFTAGFIRTFILRDLIREQEAAHVRQESSLIAEIVADRQSGGGSIDKNFLKGLVGPDSRLVFKADGQRPVVVKGADYRGVDGAGDPLSTTVETYGATVTVSQSGSVSRQILMRNIGSMLLVYFLIAMLAGAIGYLLARRLSKPFRELASAAAALGRGRFDLELPNSRIPEARAIAQALGTSAGQLEDRLRREREFAEHASHVLRSPLTGLRLELEDLTMRGDVPEEAQQAAERGMATIDEMDTVAGELVEMSRSGILVAGSELPLVELATQLAQRWADRLASRNRTLTASAEGDLSLSYTPGPVEHVFDLVMAEVFRRGTGPVHIVYRGQEGGHLRIKIAALGRTSDLTGSEPETRLQQARAVVEALGGRINGHDPAHGLELLLPRR
ncbi:sensor histidine kinase [Nocardioides sp.]|uniref:sensor histidine kinase n=1 Tax=Nocardioides sp. TaxID=35761 RepID=UPI003562AD24